MFDNLATLLYDSSWAITKEALEGIIATFNKFTLDSLETASPEALQTKFGKQLPGTFRAEIRDGIAIIPVVGPIFPRANLFTFFFGGTTLQTLAIDFQAALDNKDVKGILFNVDSPGGSVTGVGEFASQVAAGRNVKPVKSYVYGGGASAAYWIISPSSEIIASETAQVGSIGIIAAIRDTRERDSREGVKTIEFVSSVSPYKNLDLASNEGIARIQRTIDSLGGIMVQQIADFRGTDADTVLAEYGQGDVFTGALAYGRGLIDGIGSFESVLSTMVNKSTKTFFSAKGELMDINLLKAEHPEVYKAIFESGVKQGEASAQEKIDAARAEGKVEGVKEERTRLQEIDAIKAPGFENIIAENRYKDDSTKASISSLILEAQEEKRQGKAAGHEKDAKALGTQTKEIGKESTDEPDAAEEKAAIDNIVASANADR